jgi:hypothetical protein
MKDRLRDLRTQADIPESTEIELQPTNEVPSSYQDLFSHVEQVSDSINKLEVTVNDMRRLHDEIIHNPLAHPPGGASPTDRLEAMMADVKLDASSVQARLKNMEKQIEEDQRGSGRHSTELRIRKAHVMLKNPPTSLLPVCLPACLPACLLSVSTSESVCASPPDSPCVCLCTHLKL